MSGAEAVIRSLEAAGVEICFGIPGGAILPIYDALAHSESPLQHILVRHEQGGGHMAQGYARATGKVGVAWATSGPGATNLVTPVADAFLDSTPMVVVTGQVPTHLIGTDAFQEADTTGIFMPIVKHSFLIQRPEDITRCFREAFHIASTGPAGPGAHRRSEGRRQAEVDIPLAGRGRSAGLPPDAPRPPAAGAVGRRGDRGRRAARALRRRRDHQCRGAPRAARARRGGARPGRDDADGQGRLPRLASAVAADARHARLQVRELGAAPVRPADRRRRALRRPRDRQARRVRTGRARDPHGHRPGGDLEEPPCRHPDRRRAARRCCRS